MNHPPIRSQEHANKVGQLVGWAYKTLTEEDALIFGASLLEILQSHPAYDEVFKGLILCTNEGNDGIRMLPQEEVLKGIALDSAIRTALD